jgi:glycosyltransferase involved in cell wall biosynthesis
MLMGAFPIQSNPGGVTEELIIDGENGLLISDPENTDEIAKLIRRALSDDSMIMRAREANDQIVRGRFSFESVKAQIQSLYYLS